MVTLHKERRGYHAGGDIFGQGEHTYITSTDKS